MDKNKIVSIGWNDGFKTHPFAKKHGYRFDSIHSELAAVIKVGLNNCKGLTLVNFRVNSFGEIGMSKPCLICQRWLKNLELKRILYTNINGKLVTL